MQRKSEPSGPEPRLTQQEAAALRRHEWCKVRVQWHGVHHEQAATGRLSADVCHPPSATQFTSLRHKSRALKEVNQLIRTGKAPEEPEDSELWSIDWKRVGCKQGAQWGAKSCPHLGKWFYTVNDAHSAMACQVLPKACRTCFDGRHLQTAVAHLQLFSCVCAVLFLCMRRAKHQPLVRTRRSKLQCASF
jgi:hypothetical protein